MNEPLALINPRGQNLFEQHLAGLAGDDDYGDFDLFGIFKKKSPGTEKYSTKPPIESGSSDEGHVKEIQSLLGIKVDGRFLGGTATAVKEFQASQGLEPSGKVDTDTWAALYGKPTSAQRQEKTAKTITDITGLASGLFSQLGPGSQLPAAPMPSLPEAAPAPDTNYLMWGLGAVVVLGLGVGAVYALSPKKE